MMARLCWLTAGFLSFPFASDAQTANAESQLRWFDATELDAVLRFIKLGGERVSDERQQQEERARASQLKFKVEPKAPEDARGTLFAGSDHESGFDAIPSIVNWLLKL